VNIAGADQKGSDRPITTTGSTDRRGVSGGQKYIRSRAQPKSARRKKMNSEKIPTVPEKRKVVREEGRACLTGKGGGKGER